MGSLPPCDLPIPNPFLYRTYNPTAPIIAVEVLVMNIITRINQQIIITNVTMPTLASAVESRS